MRTRLFLSALILVSVAYAREPRIYQRAKLLRMESVACGTEEKDSQSLAGEIAGTDSSHKKTHELLCQEYVLQAADVNYRVRPRDEKHPVLLPIGEWAQFRVQKDKLILRIDGFDNKEREFNVVSIMPRSIDDTADAGAVHVNHLQ